MKTSNDRILTTHTGSLPRPKPLIDLIMRREKGEAIDADAFEAEVAKAVDDIVAQQVAAGIDVVSDGEMSKPSYTTYIRHRVSGIELDPRAAEKGRDIMIGRDLLEHPDFARQRGNFSDVPFPGCVGRLALQGPHRARPRSRASQGRGGEIEADRRVHDRAVAGHPDALHHQPALSERGRLRRGARRRDEDRIPRHRRSRLRAADRRARSRLGAQQPVPPPHRRRVPHKIAERNIAALNAATEGLPADRMRLHICWGNYEGPHTHDLPLTKIIDIAFKARPQAISIEAANPRHDHEWEDLADDQNPRRQDPDSGRHRFDHQFRRASAPGGAAHRAATPAVVDRERLIAGVDCGFGTAVRTDPMVADSIVWAKLARAQRRRRDRQQAPVGQRSRMTPWT